MKALFWGILTLTIASADANAGKIDSFQTEHVKPYSDKTKGYSGGWVHLSEISINGITIDENFSFEYGKNYFKSGSATIGISSRHSKIKVMAAQAHKRNVGNRFFITASSFGKDFTPFMNSLDADDLLKLNAICSLVTDSARFGQIVRKMTRSMPSDLKYRSHWQNANNIKQIRKVASNCMKRTDDRLYGNGPVLQEIQVHLHNAGYYNGEIDGITGPVTRNAIAAYKRATNSYSSTNLQLLSILRKSTELQSNDHVVIAAAVSAPNSQTGQSTGRSDLISGMDTEAMKERINELERQLAAANETAADRVALSDHASIQRQLSAANATIAEMVSVKEAEELRRQLDAANSTIADMRDNNVPARQLTAANSALTDLHEEVNRLRPLQSLMQESTLKIVELERQREALNDTIASLKDDSVSATEYERLQLQLDAANSSLADLSDRIEREFVPAADFVSLRSQLSAANQTLADLRETIETRYTPNSDHQRILRQVEALNETVTVITERSEKFKGRWLDTQRMYDGFVDTCRDDPVCARTMELDG